MASQLAAAEVGPLPGEMLPDFALPSSRRAPLGPRAYKRRRNLVLAFVQAEDGDRCGKWLRRLAERQAELAEEDAEVLVVVEGPIERLEALALPFPLLADESGAVHARYGARGRSAVFIADRYGEIRERWVISDGPGRLPSPDEVIAWLRLIEIECPE